MGWDALPSSNADSSQGRIQKRILKIAGNLGKGGRLAQLSSALSLFRSLNDDDGNKRSTSAWNGNNSMRTRKSGSNCDGSQTGKLREINGPILSS